LRIAFFCYWNLLEKDGVAKKVDAQTGAWRALGHEVQVFCVSQAPPEATRDDWRLFRFADVGGRIRATRALEAAVLEWRPDVAYGRYDLYLPPLGRLLRAVPGVLEINADDREEARLVRGRQGRMYNDVNRRVLIRRARGLACVTHELAASPSFARFGKPSVVVGNSVDLDAIQPVPVAPRDGPPHVVFLGTRGQPWHGIDKIVELARALPEVEFDVIGYSPDALSGAPANVRAHGTLGRREYARVVAGCVAGIGTLALHRKNMHEACPLKVREYLAFGLPTVVAYEDTDFRDVDPWYLLRLPNVESNARDAAGEIRAFLERVRSRRVLRDEVAERIGVAAKERRRVAFLEGLLRA
jgi:glycosyltransferase involved in cell wall biosynthesis